MCFVVQNYLGKGTRCAFPLHPSRRGSDRGSTPCKSQQNVSPFNHSQGLEKCLSTCTEPCMHGCPSKHHHFMETNPARIGYRHLAEDGSLSGVYHHPQTQLIRLGEFPLHRHRTMHNQAARLTRATPWRPCHGDDFIETNRRGLDRATEAPLSLATMLARLTLHFATRNGVKASFGHPQSRTTPSHHAGC